MTDFDRWKRDGELNGWVMPSAVWWKRLPVVRQFRSAIAKNRIENWYAYGPGSLGLRTGYDDWVVFGIWHGMEQS